MNKILSFAAALSVAAMPLLSHAAINQVTVNGKVNDTVRPGSTVTVGVDFDLAAGQQIESASVEFLNSNLPKQRFNISPDFTQPGHYHLDIKGVKVPPDQGLTAWDNEVTLCGDPGAGAVQNCETGTEIFTYPMTGQITADGTMSSSTSTSMPSNVNEFTAMIDQYDLPPFIVQMLINAWIAQQNPVVTPSPTPTPAPTVKPVCAQFSAYSYLHTGSYGAADLQRFLIGQGYSIPAGATGFYGSQTSNAVTAFQSVNHC